MAELFDQKGQFNVRKVGVPRSVGTSLHADLYHALRSMTWTRLLVIIAILYFGANVVFAAVMFLGHAKVANADPSSFADYFWFSIQTMATIGYGGYMPQDVLAHSVVAVESFAGLLFTAMATGLFFAKFSTPQAKVMFSKRFVIADYAGTPTLMFRMANARETAIVEATAKVALLRDEQLPSGERLRRIYDLPLRRATSPMFALSWTVYHAIDDASPLAGETAESMRDSNTSLSVTFTGIDDRLAQQVHSRHFYTYRDVLFGHRFADMLTDDPETGTRIIDYRKFDDVVPV